MKQIIKTIAAGVIAVAAWSNVAASADPLLVSASKGTMHTPLLYAAENGIFEKHGVEVELKFFQTGVEMINGLMAGTHHMNTMGSIPLIAGASNGLDLVLIGHLHGRANADSYSDNTGIVADKSIKTVTDLKGKKIALPRGTGAEGYLLGVLSQNNMTASDVTLVSAKPSELSTALRNGDVDAIAIWETHLSGTANSIESADVLISGNCNACYDPGTLITTNAIIKERGEQLRKFMLAFAEASQWVRNNLDKAAEVNIRWSNFDNVDVMKSAMRNGLNDPRMSKLTVETYKSKTVPGLKTAGKLGGDVDVDKMVDPQFVTYMMDTVPQFFDDLEAIPANKRF